MDRVTATATMTKADAHYRPATRTSGACAACAMFIPATGDVTSRCTLVKGMILPTATCDYFEPIRKGTLRKPPAVIPVAGGPPVAHHKHVRVIVLNADGQMLLLQRADYPEQWEPVQGTVGDHEATKDEKPHDAAHRELEEETGYLAAAVSWTHLGPRTWIARLPRDAGPPHISDEHLAYRWSSPEEADQWLARERFYARFETDTALAKQGDDLPDEILQAADLGNWDPLARLIAGPLGEGAAEGVLQSRGEAALEGGALDVAHTRAMTYAAARAAELVTNIEETTRSGLRRLVEQALQDGWSPQDLADAVQSSPLFGPKRADMIARTELALAHSNGTLAGWKESGLVEKKRWLLSDSHVGPDECDDNADIGAIALSDSFPSGDDGPPAHPNCMCVAVPVIAGEDDS